MAKDQDIKLKDLNTIAKVHIKDYLHGLNIYSILTLALIVTTKYSRKPDTINLPSHTRIDLTLSYVPDLIEYLIDQDYITYEIGNQLLQEYQSTPNEELYSILKSYLYVNKGLCEIPVKSNSNKFKHCILL